MSHKVNLNLPDYLSGDIVLIKNYFVETTRKGEHLYSVNIALTPTALVIKSTQDSKYQPKNNDTLKLFESHHSLQTTKIKIFKKSQRQSIKVCFSAVDTKYYELVQSKKSKIFWKLWCAHIGELHEGLGIWPFSQNNSTNEDVTKSKSLPWTDKYLYLGSKRAAEDNDRPKPVPGLGPTEDIKLLYLKPKYFGCWDQSEHWVQCGNSSTSFIE